MDNKTSLEKLPSTSKVSENDKEAVKYEAEEDFPVASIVICDDSGGIIPKASSRDVPNTLDIVSEQDIPRAVLLNDWQVQFLSPNWWSRPVHRKIPIITPFVLCIAFIVTCCTLLAIMSHNLGKNEGNMIDMYDHDTKDPFQAISMSPTSSLSHAAPSPWKSIGQNIEGFFEQHHFGEVVSLSSNGDFIAIGSKYGSCVYKFENDLWKQMGGHISHCNQYLKNNNKTNLTLDDNDEITICDSVGYDIAISADGSRILNGAAFSDNGYALVHEFDELNSNWKQLGNTIYGEKGSDRYGFLVAFSAKGDRAAILASSGQYIDIYDLTTTKINDNVINSWNKTHTIYESIPWRKGSNFLSMSGNGKFIATRSAYIGVAIYIQVDSSSWKKTSVIEKKITIDQFGHALSFSETGDRIAIGAPLSNEFGSYVGYVQVYEFHSNESSWKQLGNSMFAKEFGSQSGSRVALSGDGNRVIFGSIGEIFKTSDEPRSKVLIFDLIDAFWIQVGPNILADTTDNAFGSSVSISSDGKRAAVGAPSSDCIDVRQCGVVHVYEFDSDA